MSTNSLTGAMNSNTYFNSPQTPPKRRREELETSVDKAYKNISFDSPPQKKRMIDENKEYSLSKKFLVETQTNGKFTPPPTPMKHSSKKKSSMFNHSAKPTTCNFNGTTYSLQEVSYAGTENNVYLMLNDKHICGVYKIPKNGSKLKIEGALKQYQSLKGKIGTSVIYNEATSINDGYIVEEYFPKVLSNVVTFYSEQNKPFFVTYGQFLKKVIESGIKNVDVKPNNIGIRVGQGTFEFCLFDFDGEQDDESLLRIKQGIENFCKGNSEAAAVIADQLKDLQGDLAKEVIEFCKSIVPFTVTVTLPIL